MKTLRSVVSSFPTPFVSVSGVAITLLLSLFPLQAFAQTFSCNSTVY